MANRRFRVVRRRRNQVEIVGINFNHAARTRWRSEIDDFGRMLQALIAREFSEERVAGQALRPNQPSYTAWKAREGFDPRKGHKTNALQRALSAGRLYNITFSGGGRVFVTFIENRLFARIPYAEYYAAAKVRHGKILAVSKRMVDDASKALMAFARRVERNFTQSAVAAGAGTAEASAGVTRAAAMRRLQQQADDFAAQLDFRRKAPLRQEHLGPKRLGRMGLTQRQAAKIRKSAIDAAAAGDPRKRKRLERALSTAARTAEAETGSLIRNLNRVLRRAR